jgi:hypothetical protein
MINKMILFLEYFLWLTEDLKKISLICCNVSEGVALSKEQVVESRKIAGIRIHVERAISRIREFSFLAPHVRLDSNLIKYCDSVMYCVCGLLNVRGPLIK